MTTLCYIESDNKYLMLRRVKNDINEGKWIGIGGHFEKDETPEECLLREVYEETGLMLKSYSLSGVITFISDKWDTEYIFLYTLIQEMLILLYGLIDNNPLSYAQVAQHFKR